MKHLKHLLLWIKWGRYLRKRGWKKDRNGWYRSFNPLLPQTAAFYHESRESQKEGIDLEQAIKFARYSDPDDIYVISEQVGDTNAK